ncbi:hypothetical protein J2847_005910 [Azospirillum agricola]|uniref:hypothetical protein n=1 Tax=Azospirillum agricola TaxID=1720247 RepID=UPI001AE81612|nr:hypothetical protein [Azospirillum agricola]MBP2232579.1 hypothetical protein [Azospirillum agricola]
MHDGDDGDDGDDGCLDIVQAALTGPVPLVIDVAMDDFTLDASDPRQIAAGVVGFLAVDGGWASSIMSHVPGLPKRSGS